MRLALWTVLTIGLLQMAADLAGLHTLKGLSAATLISPAPKVFSAVRGLETYSNRFHLEWMTPTGDARDLIITPERYAGVRGPYNRRNMYGAAVAYAPVLPATLRDPVLVHAVCKEAPLLRELGVSASELAAPYRLSLEPIETTNPEDLELSLEVRCP